MDTQKNIFELERRIDLKKEYQTLILEMSEYYFEKCAFGRISLRGLLEETIAAWPYRQAANSLASFAERHGFSFDEPSDDSEIILCLELIINLLYYSPEFERVMRTKAIFGYDFLNVNRVNDKCTRCIEDITFILEQINMKIREQRTEGSVPQFFITKRDVDVDITIESVPELKDIILSYLDIRNSNDIDTKRQILKRIADYLEPQRKKYQGIEGYKGLCDDCFAVFNGAFIRHNNKNQWLMSESEYMELYDQTFKSAIHLMQYDAVKMYKDRVAVIKGSR